MLVHVIFLVVSLAHSELGTTSMRDPIGPESNLLAAEMSLGEPRMSGAGAPFDRPPARGSDASGESDLLERGKQDLLVLAFEAPSPLRSGSPLSWASGPLEPGPTSLALTLEPYGPPVLPCACGCGIFEVGGSMLPQGQGGVLFFEWDYQDQNHNWSRHSRAPASDNPDQLLWTSFYRVGLQYMFNERWGLQVDLPFAHRYFRTFDATSGANQSTEWTDWGDMRVKGLYTGFFKDMSLGVDFGLKLPTGNYTHEGADRDTELGSGSTDLLLGGFYRIPISADSNWSAFFQVEGDFPLFIRDQYRPGLEVDASTGIDYQGFSLGKVAIVPFGQVLFAGRTSDRGANSASPIASGYQRVLLSPGLELMMHPFMLYLDVEFPVWQNMRGDQLVASALFKVVLAFSF